MHGLGEMLGKVMDEWMMVILERFSVSTSWFDIL